ncbi:3148_t:CDS:1 [Paraglomus brasilianum]|uniref:3148_t:CDS:1 n=1 Tax=Paraglomus brasilianum TaxID=144538 RepID=A0A9N9F092_9GLOM|nr:3148_t:CDS:1 [Paraglomus brasilianum]
MCFSLKEVLSHEDIRFMREYLRQHGGSLFMNLEGLINRPTKQSKNKKRLKKDGKLPKPPNPWILFYRNYCAKIAKSKLASHLEQRNVNGKRTVVRNTENASDEWSVLEPHHKRFYELLAEIAKFVHTSMPSREEISQWLESIGYKPPDSRECDNGGQLYVGNSRFGLAMVRMPLTTSVDGMNPGNNSIRLLLQGHPEFRTAPTIANIAYLATSPNSLAASTNQHHEQNNILGPYPEFHTDEVADSSTLTTAPPVYEYANPFPASTGQQHYEGGRNFVEGLDLPTGENAAPPNLATATAEQDSFDGYVKGLELDHSEFSEPLADLF